MSFGGIDPLRIAQGLGDLVSGGNDDQRQRQQGGELEQAFARCQQAIRDYVPAGRQQALAQTNLEQSAMWCRAAIEGAR